jgi:predicted DCC family thiol-disulfide oxidoreductase YuxK
VNTKLAPQREIDLVYDEHCYFCTRSLYMFKILDTTQTVNYYSQYDCPEKLKNEKRVDFDEEMYVFANNEPHGGYYAFRQLCKQFPATAPLSWFMTIPPVATVGEYIYKYIAENRDRHFVCSYEANSK